MRLCKCGGMITQHQLSNDREAWTCRSCGRYEIIEQKKSVGWTPEEDEAFNDVEKQSNLGKQILRAIKLKQLHAEQEVKPCQFANGACIHCEATEREDCEGWVFVPHRSWVGLTDAEIDVIGDKVANEELRGDVPNFRVRFARAIEAAHGIKSKTNAG